ncbi:putative histidinol-phosphate/aromatic aminotransferase and cobyric acid decarboxylase [Desulfamplus magnetovallimortis]|uniref:Putative histidinol-phosphate/aromatic aminotransferase and cobyric acid decarboxylase n=1 Tax=Desulfamplus magnetovallimortis TaxID=1246637 RepID=A0A1W1HH10_9BACT|nr:aminotransferase class I/II-fold pyridoxal phosphate-dependent enzyme [Desulfamplus magnetovallimortis]SLM31759.1 putative histidinol-phosphate/aromatic aminotransferase and cobyric acid decarboxylase [Desulfamplus magnetovallimortis]
MITGHGGNVQDLAKQNHCSIDEIIDMSSNINPLGPPEGVEAFIANNIAAVRSLPQPDARDMVTAFSKVYDIPFNRVIGGNGTTWFIYTLPLALGSKGVLIAGPTYADYRDGCKMHHVPLDFLMADESNMFKPDIEALSRRIARSRGAAKNTGDSSIDASIGTSIGASKESLTSSDTLNHKNTQLHSHAKEHKIDTVFICNPNNPTGALIQHDDLISLLKEHPDVFFIIDESYLPFVIDAENISLVSETRYPNLIVLSSMSKIFRIPGLRTGFLCADPSVTEQIMTFYQPWSVNALAQAAVLHILENSALIAPFLETTRRFVQQEKQLFTDSLNAVAGLELDIYPGETYFLLAKLTGTLKSHELCDELGRHKILIRDCANFDGLSDSFVRFSLRDRDSNQKLADILKLCCAKDSKVTS